MLIKDYVLNVNSFLTFGRAEKNLRGPGKR